jgi:hypothetical protein
MDINIKSAQLELDQQLLLLRKSTADIESSVKAAHKSAEDANEAFAKLSAIEKKLKSQAIS